MMTSAVPFLILFLVGVSFAERYWVNFGARRRAACQGYLYVVEPGKKQVFSAGVAFTTTLVTARAKN